MNNRSGAHLPAGLAAAVQRTLGQAEVAAYAVRRAGAGYRALNPAQGLQVDFTAGGPQLSARVPGRAWTWGLRFAGYGRGTRLQAVDVGPRVIQGALLTYRHRGLSEWYSNSAAGLEQGFTLPSRLAGLAGQPVRLVLRLSGSLRAHLATGGQVVDLLAACRREARGGRVW